MKKWIAILLVAVMALSLTACKKKDKNDNALIGLWELDPDATLAGLSESDRAEFEDELRNGYNVSIAFNKDGTGTVIIFFGDGQTDGSEMTYTAKDGKLIMTNSNNDTLEYPYSIEGGKLHLALDSQHTMVLRKK